VAIQPDTGQARTDAPARGAPASSCAAPSAYTAPAGPAITILRVVGDEDAQQDAETDSRATHHTAVDRARHPATAATGPHTGCCCHLACATSLPPSRCSHNDTGITQYIRLHTHLAIAFLQHSETASCCNNRGCEDAESRGSDCHSHAGPTNSEASRCSAIHTCACHSCILFRPSARSVAGAA
jgi:hypothetical protein